jgi:thiol-disulfide isomerase/thioredoxin
METPSTKRRKLLLVTSVAGCAGLAGAWWRGRQSETPPATAQLQTAALPANFWSMQFPQPGGAPITMASLQGKSLVINFWATWCPPCLREMPALSRFQRQFANQNWQVLGLAVDSEQAVLAYLAKSPVSYPVALAGLEGVDLSRAWGNTSGGLPFTVVLDKMGQVLHTLSGEASDSQMAAWANGR